VTVLAVISTHPIQYHAPVYRSLQQRFGIPTTAIYGSDCSVAGYHDPGFNAHFSWDTDLLTGYTPLFLSRTQEGGPAMGLPEALRTVAPSAVLLTGYSPRFHQRAFYHAWKLGRPILFRGETNDRVGARNRWKSRVRRMALQAFYERCSRLLYVGQCSHQHFKDLQCPEDKLVFSPYCVDNSTFESSDADRVRLRVDSRETMGLRDSQIVLLLSGKLIARKFPDGLLGAVKALRSRRTEDFVVVFLGDGEMADDLKRLAPAAPGIEVRFLGFQNQTRLSRYYHAADLLVLPSLEETWGLVVNEALVHGLPAVVSDRVGCGPDLIQPGLTGEVFETGSVASLAAAIERALALIRRPEIRIECRKTADEYSVEKAASGIAAAYRAVTSGPGTLWPAA